MKNPLSRTGCPRASSEVGDRCPQVDILPAMNGRDSYGVPAGFAGSLGSSHNRLTSAEDYARGFTFELSARRSFGRENLYHAEQKGNRLPRLTPA